MKINSHKKNPRKANLFFPNEKNGKTGLHYAAQIPSLLLLIDLIEEGSISPLTTDIFLNLPSRYVPIINLTSRKFTHMCERNAFMEHVMKEREEEDFNFGSFEGFSETKRGDFSNEKNQLESPKKQLKARLSSSLMLKNSKKSFTNIAAKNSKKIVIKLRNTNDTLKQEKDESVDGSEVSQIPRMINKSFANTSTRQNLVISSKRTPDYNIASNRDSKDISKITDTKYFLNSFQQTANSRISNLKFNVKSDQQKLIDVYQEKLKTVGMVLSRIWKI